jgi:acetylornithine deacetylase
VVPDNCLVTVDRRLLPGVVVEDGDRRMNDLVGGLRDRDNLLDVDIRRTVTAPAIEIAPDAEVAAAARRASTRILGYDPGFGYKVATTDASWLVTGARISTVLLGPGDPEQAHCADEWIQTEQLSKAAQAIALTILDLLGIQP